MTFPYLLQVGRICIEQGGEITESIQWVRRGVGRKGGVEERGNDHTGYEDDTFGVRRTMATTGRELVR